MENYPIYFITISDNADGIEAISLVEEPATEVQMLVFNNNQEQIKFTVNSDEKRIITAPIMLANTPIFRSANWAVPVPHYISFNFETIEKMRNKYFKDNVIDKFNTDHKSNTFFDGMYIIESYIVTEETKAPKALGNIPTGSWIGSFKVENDEIWSEIKAGKFGGISLEGFFSYKDEELTAEDKLFQEVLDILNKII